MPAADPYVATRPAITQVFTEGYMSGETLINRPDIYEMVFPFMKEEETFVDFLLMAGKRKVTIQSTYYWHEEDALIPMAKIKSFSGAGGAGVKGTFVIYALNAAKESPFKKWDVLQIGTKNAWIEKDSDITLSPGDGLHSYAVMGVNNTIDIKSYMVNDAYVIWVGTMKADGTAQPGSMISKPLPFSGNTQIIATNYTTHGSAAANKAFFMSKSGKEYFYYRGVEQAVTRHKLAILYTLLLGQQAVSLNDTVHEDGSQPVRGTSGLEEVIRTNGNLGSNGAFAFEELRDKINKKLDEVFGPSEYFSICGNVVKYAVDDVLFDRNITNVAPQYGAFSTRDWLLPGDPKERAVSYNFASARLGLRTFHFRQEKALYYTQITGAPGKTYPGMMINLPADQFRDPKSGEWNDSVCVRTKQSDREDRFTTEWVRDYKTDDIDKFRFNHRSEIGWMQGRARQTYLWEIA